MPVIVTRPEQEARQWAKRLRDHGLDAIALPLIAIGPAPEPGALARARAGIASFAAVMFVSANAVRAFFAEGLRWPAGVRAWSPGPGTAQALREAGVDASAIDGPAAASAQFDSEALWEAVGRHVKPGSRVLLVRGADARGQAAGRDWLRDQVEAAGGEVAVVAAYARRAPRWSPAELELADRAGTDGSTWLFSSSEAIGNLRSLLPGRAWPQARALATHPRIADAAREAGFGVVCTCRPAFDEVLASLQSAG